MNKFIHFGNTFFNTRYLIKVVFQENIIIFVPTNGFNSEFRDYDEAAKTQLLQDLESLM
jgi:hypothetical protein